jgi:hypothetical protein
LFVASNTLFFHYVGILNDPGDAEAKTGLFDFADDLQTVSHLPEWVLQLFISSVYDDIV